MSRILTILVLAVTSMTISITVRAEPTSLAPTRLSRAVERQMNEVFDQVEQSGDLVEGEIAVSDLFDSVLAWGHQKDAEAFRESAFAVRLMRQLSVAENIPQVEMLRFLRENEDFAHALVFLTKPGEEDVKEVYALANRLRLERGDRLNDYANLAAAICVVHDKPMARSYNENRVASPDPVILFDFYSTHEKRMLFGMKEIPAELLVHVVDVTASVNDLMWALDRFAGHRNVGELFFAIEYDFDHYKKGTPKKCTLAGYSLPSIAQFGGVCADQAYFAVTVGKAIGVPAAYTLGKSAEVGHAWVGFLQSQGKRAWWNFNTGRYESYQGLRGNLLDPQTRQYVDDSSASLLADFALSRKESRFEAAAYIDAATRLKEIATSGNEFNPPWVNGVPAPVGTASDSAPRGVELLDQLRLVEAGLREAPGYAPGWYFVRDLASERALSLDDKKYWAGILTKLCGSKYPDFSLDITAAMILAVDDVQEQNTLWNTMFKNYQRRMDLAASIRMAQGKMWEEAGDVNMAGQCYMDVVNRYANDGPFVVRALEKAETLLRESERADEVIGLYASAWQRIKRPEQMAGQFAKQSNWYQVGLRLATVLDEFGQAGQAGQVLQTVLSASG